MVNKLLDTNALDAIKSYIGGLENYVGDYRFFFLDAIDASVATYFNNVLLPEADKIGWDKVVILGSRHLATNAMGLYMFDSEKVETSNDVTTRIVTFSTIHGNLFKYESHKYAGGYIISTPTTTKLIITIENGSFAGAAFDYKSEASNLGTAALPIGSAAEGSTAFIPTHDAEPTSKQYVDERSTHLFTLDDTQEEIINTEANRAVGTLFLQRYFDGKPVHAALKASRYFNTSIQTEPESIIDLCSVLERVKYSGGEIPYISIIGLELSRGSTFNTYGVSTKQLYKINLNLDYTVKDGIYTCTEVEFTYETLEVMIDKYGKPISPSNTNAYAVTEDYNPAHKKYVDDVALTLQRKPVIIYDDATGFEASNNDAGDTWHLENLDLSKYKRLKFYVRSGGDGDANYSSAHLVEMHLDDRAKGSFGYFTGSHVGLCPNNTNRLHIATFVVNAEKTAIQFQRSISLYGTAASDSVGGRSCYLIEGYFD